MPSTSRQPLSRRGALRIGGLSLLGLAACRGAGFNTALRLGNFPNLTHATALVAAQQGGFEKALAPTPIELLSFNAGPAAVEALLSGALDVAYLGPNPTINAFVKSRGQGLRVIAGATSGGASLVVRSDIKEAGQLRGKSVASPQLGGTQDVALRAWLAEHKLATDAFGGGDVSIVPQENAQTLEAFRSGTIAAAWVPEPWATRLVLEGGGVVLVDERTLWPEGRFVSAHVVASAAALANRRADVLKVLKVHIEATAWIAANAAAAQAAVIDRVEVLTGKRLSAEVIAAAWDKLEFTTDTLSSTLLKSADAAASVGLLKLDGVDLQGLWDTSLLDELKGGGT